MANLKHIVIIGPAFPLRGGLASFNERLAKELQETTNDVSIFTFSLQYPSFLFPGKTQYASGNPPLNIKIRVLINSINPLNWIKTGLILKKLKPDLIIVRYWLPFMGPCLGSILRIARYNHHSRIICIADNILPHEKRLGDTIFTEYFIKPIDAFITMSEKVFGDLKKLNSTKPAITIPHPLYDNFGEPIQKEIAREHLGLPNDRKIILFFGFIRHYKGLDILLEAISDNRIKEKNILLLIAGEFYQDSKPYFDLIKKLGLGNYVSLHTNFIEDSEVKYYCSSADLIVQPYRSATQSGVTPLAYHFNKPMVVTNVGGLAKMVIDKKSGLIAEPDPGSIADKIIEYFEIGETFFMTGLQQEKTKLSWNAFSNSLIKLYHDIQK
jgi:glycosyltransferase involved in cell wall biosynthesis